MLLLLMLQFRSRSLLGCDERIQTCLHGLVLCEMHLLPQMHALLGERQSVERHVLAVASVVRVEMRGPSLLVHCSRGQEGGHSRRRADAVALSVQIFQR